MTDALPTPATQPEGAGQPVPPLDPAEVAALDAATFTVVSHVNR